MVGLGTPVQQTVATPYVCRGMGTYLADVRPTEATEVRERVSTKEAVEEYVGSEQVLWCHAQRFGRITATDKRLGRVSK
jgi:hypothetical protein